MIDLVCRRRTCIFTLSGVHQGRHCNLTAVFAVTPAVVTPDDVPSPAAGVLLLLSVHRRHSRRRRRPPLGPSLLFTGSEGGLGLVKVQFYGPHEAVRGGRRDGRGDGGELVLRRGLVDLKVVVTVTVMDVMLSPLGLGRGGLHFLLPGGRVPLEGRGLLTLRRRRRRRF